MKQRGMMVLVAIASISISSLTLADGVPDGTRWWSHVRFLADDKLEGRNTGSEGHRKAAAYVAEQFERSGLKPVGKGGYFQPVKLQSKEIDESHSSLALVRGRNTEPLVLGRDATIGLRGDPAPSIDAELVFAGYGLVIPEANHDDFKGMDVRGKVVMFLSGAPASIPGPLAAHMQSTSERAALLKRAGAIGSASIANPKNMDIPWERASLARFMPSMTLADPALDESHGMKIAIAINPAQADKWLSGSGHTFQQVLEAADSNKPLPHFVVGAKLKAMVAVKRSELESQNVLAVLPGNDPLLQDEYVVFSAHLDHLGVGKPIKDDAIYNGAMDNASGVASLIEVAAMLKESGTKLRRSVLFAAVTGEEKGLLGSRFLANSSTIDPKMIIADVNTDMFLPLFPFKALTVFGIDESDLGDDAMAVAKSLGIAPQADPEPKRNRFVRSDQYSFIRSGIPSLALKLGYYEGSPEAQIVKKWLTERYHAPSDDLNQPVDIGAAAQFNTLVAKLLRRIADRDERPRWKDASFFKRFAR